VLTVNLVLPDPCPSEDAISPLMFWHACIDTPKYFAFPVPCHMVEADTGMPPACANDVSQILELDLGSLTAGCMMPGEFEERLKAVLNEVSQQRGRVILFIDDIHNLVPAAGAAVGVGGVGRGWRGQLAESPGASSRDSGGR
jgi:hypothetical protein